MSHNNNPAPRTLLHAVNENALFWVVVTLIASSVEPIVVKIGYRGSMGPFHFLFIKAIVGALMIIPLTGRLSQFSPARARFFLPVTFLFAITTAFVILALKHLTAVMVITIITSTPAIVALINQARGKETAGIQFWIGFVLCLIGIMLTLEIGGRDTLSLNLFGMFCAVASVVTSALYRTRMDDITREYTPLTSSLYIFLLNGVIVSILCLPWVSTIPVRLIPLGVAIGVAGAVANVAFLSALHLLGSTRISIVGILQRPLVILAVALILKESLSIMQVVGIILVLAGIQLATVKKILSTEKKG